jgi:glycosyltransferase involved in cell wall biosynthesis
MVKVCGKGSKGKVRVVHCGVEPDDFAPAFEARSRGVLTVARLVEKKGIGDLVDAFGILKEKGKLGGLKLTVAGGGPLEGELKERCRKEGLDDIVTFRGFLDDDGIERLFGSSLMFVLPCVEARSGDIDGIPVTLMESMAREVPVISTGVSGIPELIGDGKTGLLVPPGDSAKLARAIHRLRNDPELARALGREGRRKVLREFNIRRSAARLISLWEEVVG